MDAGHGAQRSHPWLAADPILGPRQKPAALAVVQTGAWILPGRTPTAGLVAFLDGLWGHVHQRAAVCLRPPM